MAVQEAIDTQLNILLHPLVILNISDHYMRIKAAGAEGPNPRVIGLMTGLVNGRTVEIHNSFEVKYSMEGDVAVLDDAFVKERQGQFSQVFPTHEILGWYSTGSAITPGDAKTQNQVDTLNENSLFLQLNPVVGPTVKELPVSIYESQLRVQGDAASQVFVKLPFKIDTTPAENVAVNHIAKNTATGEFAAARLQAHLAGIHSAVKMLGSRVKVLVQYLADVKKGNVQPTPAAMRQIASLCQRLPALDTKSFQHEHMAEFNDALLLAYLATVTKSAQTLNEVVDRFNMAFDRHSRRRGLF